MNHLLHQFIDKHLVEGEGEFTHQTMISKCKFYINKKQQQEFWNLYNGLLQKESRKFMSGICERPRTHIPVIVDIDIKKEEVDTPFVKLYTDNQVIDTVLAYQEVLKKKVKGCTDEMLTCVYLSKPIYKQIKDDSIIAKNGFHLHFPYIFMHKDDYANEIIPEVKKLMQERRVFKEMNIDKLIDSACTRNCWLVYGSRKHKGMSAYWVDTIYDHQCRSISPDKAFCKYSIYDSLEKKIQMTKPIEYYYPQIFSIFPNGRKISTIVKDKTFTHPIIKLKEEKTYRTTRSVNLDQVRELVDILDPDRAERYDTWIELGWTLFNITQASEEGLDMWCNFSSKCPDKYDYDGCVQLWSKMKIRDKNMGSLIFYADTDNHVECTKILKKYAQPLIQECINGSHNDIAKALYQFYGHKFVCSSIMFKEWYEFDGVLWRENEKGTDLRSKISSEISKEICNELQKVRQKQTDDFCNAALEDKNTDKREEAGDQAYEKILRKLIMNLKTAPFKDNVMKECQEVFYDPYFLKKMDKNPYLIGFQNGTYDLKENMFRKSEPTDYISMQMGVDYNKDLSYEHQSVKDVIDFLDKVFPDPSIRKYFLDTSSDVFVGGNPHKLVLFWSGDGHNAKSVTQSLFEQMMGQYAIKLPTSLLTGKRTASSNASPELARSGNGVRWAVLQEPDKSDVINIGVLKELSGNDTFFARALHKNGREIKPMFKLIFICNDPPKLPYNDQAAWNRIRVIPFESTFCDDAPESYEEQVKQKRFPKDPYFEDKVPGMIEAFAWYLLEHRKSNDHKFGYTEPEKVKLATSDYQKQNDFFKQFEDDVIVPDETKALSLTELYNYFKEWFRESIPNQTVPNKNDVKDHFMKAWGDQVKRKWRGKRVRTIEDDDDED